MILLGDHHVRGLDHRDRFAAGGKGEFVNRLVCDRRGDQDAVAYVDPYMRGRLAFAHVDDLALDLVAGADFIAVLLLACH